MKRWLVRAGVAAGLVALWFLTPLLLRRMSVFRIRRVDVTGSRFLTAAEVAKVADLPPGTSLFDDVEPARRRVLGIRGVARVTVHRRLPGALEFEIEEFAPVALARSEGKLVLVDRRGRVLPFDPTRAPTDLPIGEADSAVAGLLERIQDAEPEFAQTVLSAERDRNVIVLETSKHRLLFRVGATTKHIQGAAAVLTELTRRQLTVSEVDARFDGRIIVRGRGA
ncbi:MAG: FtsQ-type POTRA domain-containing protein [Gemmatimonadetes bacterium]|nr:FtsQ-type POTRA domain-containing protein [Gemmatimonadota bacterium]